jgi:hypothetical protein
MNAAEGRLLRMPAEGVIALQTVIGIIDDHALVADPWVYASLTKTLQENSPVSTGGDGDEIELSLTIAEADLLLRGLSFTEAMSVELPWYEMVVYTVQFVGDALVELWSNDEWLTYRDGGLS